MTFPVFMQDMFDFEDNSVPNHISADPKEIADQEQFFSVIEGWAPQHGRVIACRIPSVEMAKQLAGARFRHYRTNFHPHDLWILSPDGSVDRHLSVEAFFDMLGSEAEQRMAGRE